MEHILTCDDVAQHGLIERYVAGRLSEPDANALESHYLTCSRCQAEIRLALAIRDALAEAREAPWTEPRLTPKGANLERRRVPRWIATRRTAAVLAAAAAIAGLLLVQPWELRVHRVSDHREEADSGAAPTLLEPVGETRAVAEFRWTSVADADLYRVTVYSAAGQVLVEVETAGTHLVAPATTDLEPGGRYLWKVAARVGWDRWVSSELRQFVITER